MSNKAESLENIIEYVGPYGSGADSDNFWDDFEQELKDQILRYKITKVKIYYNSSVDENEDKDAKTDKEVIEEKYIIGISFTYENLFTGEIKELEHKGSDKIAGMKELIIKPGEYLKQFHINFKDEFTHISQIGFTTSKNNELSVGIKDGLDKTIKENEEDKIYLGSFGFFDKRVNGIGCLFVKRNIYLKAHLFGYFLMRNWVKKNEEFKKKWDNEYKKLNVEYQFIWKAMNLPDAAFTKIIKYCIA